MPVYRSPEGWVATYKDNQVVIKDGLATYKVKHSSNGYFRKNKAGRTALAQTTGKFIPNSSD